MVNKVILVGNLGRDPEMRSTPSGQHVASFPLATNRKWRDKTGKKHEVTEWHNIVVWGRRADVAAEFLTKGKQIYLEGRLETRSWADPETGEKRYRTQIVCADFQMLGQRGSDFEAAAPDEPVEEEPGLDEEPPLDGETEGA
jgi:single-strand DNA-binding protein